MIYQDIIKRYNIENELLAEKILKFLSENIWNLSSLRNIEKYLIQEKIKVGLTTISKYTKYFENAYLIKKVDRVWLKGKEFFKFIWKYYFSDIWIRNILIWADYNNISQILENLVYNQLLYLGYDVKVGVLWDKEIDFVITKWKEKKYIQVCYSLAEEKTREREFWNLLAIEDNFEKIVISTDEVWNFNYKGIKYINIVEFLLS
jgi:predicted AAA+ superfamily ATPase